MILATIAAIAAAFIFVIRGIICGGVKPPRATWLGWAGIDVVLAYSSYRLGGKSDPSFVLAATYSVVAVTILFFSLKYGKGGKSLLDLSCIALAILGGTASFIYGLSAIGILIAVVGIWVAGIPNILSSYKKPEEESVGFWMFSLLAVIISVIRVENWSFWANWIFPISDLTMMTIIVIPVLAKTKSLL